ncbi:hypothetical protein BDV23DRAFT_151193 [Aspergillus alliaceus]|uniref:Uncharacterized protein n=1 Tax=Petromyces alliaceus TaxID=209559 RepID=A0A5N7CE36_PETAA|nr:hypothetical protein BDV23DRAFT_151193 [Aspergillus alliaceus]
MTVNGVRVCYTAYTYRAIFGARFISHSSTVFTQGGAVFSGNLSALGDINTSHITALRPLAHGPAFIFPPHPIFSSRSKANLLFY